MFNKKENKSEVPKYIEEEKQNSRKKISTGKAFEYSIEIYDVWDTTSKRIPPFGANRIVEGNIGYLYNEQKGFKEPFPENTEEFKEYELEDLKQRIAELEKKINELQKSKTPTTVSIRDLQKQLRIYRGYKRSIELRGNGSFMILNSEGVATFQFDRIGNIKIPLYKNVDRSTIYIPSELKTKNITKILKDNDEKNAKEQTVKFATYGLVLILLLGVGFMFFMGYKMQQLPLEVSEALMSVAENFIRIDSQLETITEAVTPQNETVVPGQQTVR